MPGELENLTALHMVVIGLFAFGTVATAESAADVLRLPVDLVVSLIADLERLGLIDHATAH